jgi:hypothetical protein
MHREVLTDQTAALFPLLGRFGGFYLAGGTALALQLGHRLSVDFDMFSDDAIDRGLLARVRRVFDADVAPLVNNADELTVLIDGVKTTFLHYPFPALEPLVLYDGVPLLSVREIAATKAYTIGRRGSFKDYVDLYFVLADHHARLPQIIADAEIKFGTDFNARLFLEQLLYHADLDDTEVQFLNPAVSFDDMATFFADRIRETAETF